MKYAIKVYRFDPKTALLPESRKQQLPCTYDGSFDAPPKHDAAKKAAERFALAMGGVRVRGCSSLAGPTPGAVAGFSVIIEV
jgi:hypothetical protein